MFFKFSDLTHVKYILLIEESIAIIWCLLLYSPVVFTLNHLLQSESQSFLSFLFGAQKGTKRHSTDKISRHSLCSRIFLNENIPRSAAPCRQLPLDSRGMCKFGRANGASENLYIFSAPLCGRCLWFWQCCSSLKVTFGIVYCGNGNIKNIRHRKGHNQ
jgi:hypothetical protein